MRHSIFKLFAFIVLILVSAIPLTAQTGGTVQEIKGKVEVQEPGRAWVLARPGMPISIGASIATGFSSFAIIDLKSSTLQVSQLTRMTIEELVEKQGTVSTGLYLKVGKVAVTVKTTENITQDFKLRSAVSTAAVRGTRFTYTPYLCQVEDGIVTFFNLLDQRRTLLAAQQSGTTGNDLPDDPEDAFAENAGVPTGLLGSPFGTTGGYSDSATIVVHY